MKLNLGMNVNPKDTLRLWSAELRKRLFSSPEEFVLTAFDPTPATIIGAGYSIDQIFLEKHGHATGGEFAVAALQPKNIICDYSRMES